MIEIKNVQELDPPTRLSFARALKQHCKETGNCEVCQDKKKGEPCPYKGNPINWRV